MAKKWVLLTHMSDQSGGIPSSLGIQRNYLDSIKLNESLIG